MAVLASTGGTDSNGQSTAQSPSAGTDTESTKHSHSKDKANNTVAPREQEQRLSNSESTPSASNPPSHRPSASDVATVGSTETERSRRRRSGLDFRNSPRISELFSGFRHHRRHGDINDPPQDSTPQSSTLARSSREHITTPIINPPKPEPPPPRLPPPSLHDLGLSMSVLTASLNPPHFTSPPTSGAFLAPHYLLLCHVQGLDVLPLISPPAPEPYAIVRRVNFKSVVVMEERGVLIAIAGRRDVVRVYALDELRRVIEWRLDIEAKKEKERIRKEEGKKLSGKVDHVFGVTLLPKDTHAKLIPSAEFKPSILQPRPPTSGRPHRRARRSELPHTDVPTEPPPAYSLTNGTIRPTPSQSSVLSNPIDTRNRRASVSTISPSMRNRALAQPDEDNPVESDVKNDWMERDASSDDEAITIAAAGASGSAALDERTSTRPREPSSTDGLSVTVSHSPPHLRDLHSQSVAVISPTLERAGYFRDSFPRTTTGESHDPSRRGSTNERAILPQRSPLLGSRQALPSVEPPSNEQDTPESLDRETVNEQNEEEEEAVTPVGEVSLAQMLLESRMPDLPPPGSRTQQQAILIGPTSQSTIHEEPGNYQSISPPPTPHSARSRRRWSILGPSSSDSLRDRARESATPEMRQISRRPSTAANADLSRSSSSRALRNTPSNSRLGARHLHSSSNPDIAPPLSAPPLSAPPHPDRRHVSGSQSQSSGSFFPKFISAVLGQRPSNENSRRAKLEKDPLQIGPATLPQPKLDYVKLPGTKGSVLVKAVETSRKSFLAILCGEAGEKVELFAGTYRTALSLSRTFILPDSPRSLELQVQGDDLVEIFLVFAQNVFGLEPATVRVREVRIGRAERRAARRRARENINASGNDTPVQAEEDTNITVSIGVVASDTNDTNINTDLPDPEGPTNTGDEPDPQPSQTAPTTAPDPEELLAIASAQSVPYSTFQQLSFAPAFPLAILGDDVIIPPSYPSFLRHRTKYESTNESVTELPVQQFTPPGLPPPRPIPQSKWYYRDPKGVIQGPWKSSLMHSWYKDGLLPMDLPVRRDTDAEFCLLKDLRAQSVDPEHPFRNYATPVVASTSSAVVTMEAQPLLPPVSLLEQPRHFGPPALFFSSRGGHSTTIVDAKGRSVLKGRFMWSPDEATEEGPLLQVKLGDVQRLEAFDVRNRAIIVALRQGGLEAMDVGDALYRPADESRAYIPSFQAPLSGINRRAPYVWRIGGPLTVPRSASPIGSGDALGATLKKGSISLRLPTRTETINGSEEFEATGQEEVIFLGRKDDDLYLCEKTAISFRVLRLSPS